jgi:asparagine synthase (glutamine-hydrolysing)
MCGINGIISKNDKGKSWFGFLSEANAELYKRGPDASGLYESASVCFGHRRLSIIDLSESANQPLRDSSGKYVIVFNGEIFNYNELRTELQNEGVHFNTSGDTEVILELYKKSGHDFLNRLNGFFSFAIHNTISGEVFIARDRYGIKPLWIYEDENVFLFSSELKGLLKYPFKRNINYAALEYYLRFNYVPDDCSILNGVYKLPPGTFLNINNGSVKQNKYYQINPSVNYTGAYDDAKKELIHLLDESVRRRLISDVPVGAFLSGGIDSSVIVALASQHTHHLNTFSIGYKDDAFYDETRYAELVANKYKTNHTVFKLTQDDVLNELDDILDYLDEPFADSSALPVFLLCKYTRKKVTVALSGDGADELFGGYMKHWAEYRMRHPSFFEKAVASMGPLFRMLPKSRGSMLGNKLRQLHRFAEGAAMTPQHRYLRWCSIGDDDYVSSLLLKPRTGSVNIMAYASDIKGNYDLNDCLYSDMKLVLAGDMLVKVDLMSMANSLEVRVPFLDYTVVDFAFRIPSIFKVDRHQRKKIVQDAFRELLPSELYNRPKKGFEVPLLEWMRDKLKTRILNEWLNRDMIESQGIFNYTTIQSLIKQLESSNPGDAPARIWGLIQFQNFYNKYMK